MSHDTDDRDKLNKESTCLLGGRLASMKSGRQKRYETITAGDIKELVKHVLRWNVERQIRASGYCGASIAF